MDRARQACSRGGPLASGGSRCGGEGDRPKRSGRPVSGLVRPQTQIAEPYASQIAGDHVRAAQLWDGLGCPYQAALALLDATDEAPLRDSLTRLERLGAIAAARVARRRMRDLGHQVDPIRCALDNAGESRGSDPA